MRRPLIGYVVLASVLAGLIAVGMAFFLSGKSTGTRIPTEPQLESREESVVTDTSETSGPGEDIGEESETADASQIMDVTEMREDIGVGEESGNTDVSQIMEVTERKEFLTVFAKEGDTVGGILLRELGRLDLDLLEEVRQLNPEIEDIDRIAAGQEIRIPLESEGPIREP